MDYKTRYEKRLSKKGSDSIDALIDNTKQSFNNSFSNSPSFVNLSINGVENEGNIIKTVSSTEKTIGFRPDTVINLGDLINIEAQDFLIVEMKDIDLFPSATIQICNTVIKTEDVYTETQTGKTPWGEPITEKQLTQEGLDIPCIVETRYSVARYNDDVVNLPENRVRITMSYTTDSRLNVNKTITLYNEVYEILSHDKTQQFNGTGLLILNAERRM